MDDTKDSRYSRAPEVEDLVALCKALNESGAAYILIGGFAVILHGSVRTTKDIDFLVDASIANMQKVKNGMKSLPDNAVAQVNDDDVQKYEVVRVADEIVVDLMAKACGIDYQHAKSEIQMIIIEGVQIPFASKELLVRMKNTVRPEDKIDLKFLKWRIEEEKKGFI